MEPRMISFTLGYVSRLYFSASSLVFQKLIASTRSGCWSETKITSSTKPVWLLRRARTLSLIVRESSLAFPAFAVISTTRVNIEVLLSFGGGERRTVTTGGRKDLQVTLKFTPAEAACAIGSRR